jgi:hypothetical protein
MSDNLVLQINIKLDDPEDRFPVLDNLLNDSIKSAKTYASKVGADYIEFTGPRMYPDFSVCMEKFCVYNTEFKKYKKIFLLDTDTIVHDCCPNIFDFNNFSARPEPKTRHKLKILRTLIIDNLEHNYFNSGVMLFTRDFLDNTKHYLKKLFDYKEQYQEKNLDFYDQRIFNKIVSETNNSYNNLEYAWNCIPKHKGTHYITHYMHPWKKEYKGKINVREKKL